jgi:hypothetical protein
VDQSVELTVVAVARAVGEVQRVLIVASVSVGIIVAGLGGRLVMFALRLTSRVEVRGVTIDNCFTIGLFTLACSYQLMLIGAAVGLIGAAGYCAVRPWLVGPWWLRRLMTGLVAAAVVGSMLVHADGVDFTVPQPTWFAVGSFVAFPAVFAVVLGTVVDRGRTSVLVDGARKAPLAVARRRRRLLPARARVGRGSRRGPGRVVAGAPIAVGGGSARRGRSAWPSGPPGSPWPCWGSPR